jgi:hypothetical protein
VTQVKKVSPVLAPSITSSLRLSPTATRNRRLRGGTLALLFVEITHAQFGNADAVGFERFPNELATHPNAGIIVSRLDVTNSVRNGHLSASVSL